MKDISDLDVKPVKKKLAQHKQKMLI